MWQAPWPIALVQVAGNAKVQKWWLTRSRLLGWQVQSVQICQSSNAEGPPVNMIKRRFFPRGDGTLCYTVDYSTVCPVLLPTLFEASSEV